jgi:hypothetical protein
MNLSSLAKMSSSVSDQAYRLISRVIQVNRFGSLYPQGKIVCRYDVAAGVFLCRMSPLDET